MMIASGHEQNNPLRNAREHVMVSSGVSMSRLEMKRVISVLLESPNGKSIFMHLADTKTTKSIRVTFSSF